MQCFLKVKHKLLFLSGLFCRAALCASGPTRDRSITLTVCQGLHKLSILWCTLDVTQLSAPINPLRALCIPLQHPKLPSRVPGLTGNYWSWHGPSDYDVFYDSLDGSFIVLVAASGFWWWIWWGQSSGRVEERRGEGGRSEEKNREDNREREKQSDVLEGRV